MDQWQKKRQLMASSLDLDSDRFVLEKLAPCRQYTLHSNGSKRSSVTDGSNFAQTTAGESPIKQAGQCSADQKQHRLHEDSLEDDLGHGTQDFFSPKSNMLDLDQKLDHFDFTL